MKKWDTARRFDTALEWIKASASFRKAKVDEDILAALAECCVKRNGVWRLRKTPPKTTRLYMVYKAFQFAKHAKQWGNLAPWGESFTAELMVANDSERDLFDRAFDQLGAI